VDPTIKALVLTSYDDERALLTAVLAGASAFVLKDIRGNGLVETHPPSGGG
jgi:two-component system, NarL family, response regulator DevR